MILAPATPNGDIPPLTVGIPEAIRATDLGRSKLYQLMDDGEIEYLKVGKRRLIRYRSLVEFIDRQGPSRAAAHV